ncbi:unnamed protein product [Mytilus edulis]|uniref:Uncharacterized protein n=1 Tax=Mytilus edulis TaxID=6550 RepID=A0A8S3PUH0_MYTED|nr:unnamed protein product [Mytilus edulis]
MFLNLKSFSKLSPLTSTDQTGKAINLKVLFRTCQSIIAYASTIIRKIIAVSRKKKSNQLLQRTECSIHVTVMHRHAIFRIRWCRQYRRISGNNYGTFFVISPDLQHDNDFTKYVQKKVKEYLDSISYTVDHMHEFTDGCSSQYKSRHCLGSLSTAIPDFGYKTFHRNFFETSHAKGPQDAAGIYKKTGGHICSTWQYSDSECEGFIYVLRK